MGGTGICPGALNSSIFGGGGCRGVAKIRQRGRGVGVTVIFLIFYAIKISLFRVSTLIKRLKKVYFLEFYAIKRSTFYVEENTYT